MRKLLSLGLAMALCVSLVACGSAGTRNHSASGDVADQVINVAQSVDEHVLSVKNGHPVSYPDQTYGEAFENFFGSPTWKYFVGTKDGPDEDGDGKPDSTVENEDVVEFTGFCMYQNVEVKALIQFTLNQDDNTFEATYLSFNDVPQNLLTLNALLEKAFSEAEADEPEVSSTAQASDNSSSPDDELVSILGTWHDADNYGYEMEVTRSGDTYSFHISYMPRGGVFLDWEFSGTLNVRYGSIDYSSGVATTSTSGSDGNGGIAVNTDTEKNQSGQISIGVASESLEWHDFSGENTITFVRQGGDTSNAIANGADELFGTDAAQRVMTANILGSTVKEAYRDGWADEWLGLYYFGSSDPDSATVTQRTGNVSLETWLQDYITYEKAEQAGWGPIWGAVLYGDPTDGMTFNGYTYPQAFAAGWGDEWLANAEGSDPVYYDDYLLPTDTQYITEADLAPFSKEEIILVRNEIYARHGYSFQSENIRSYFESQGWYYADPSVNASTFGTQNMNEDERANLELIQNYEKKMGWK